MRKLVRIHHPEPTTTLPAHEHAARRKRALAGLPRTTRHPAKKPTPAAPLGRESSIRSIISRKTVDTRFPPLSI